MVFSSLTFLFKFLPIALGGYYLLPYRLKNGWIFIISLIFYSWGEVRYFPIMIASTVVDFVLSNLIKRYDGNAGLRKLYLILSVFFNLGMLFYFKYTDFFIENINMLFGSSIPLLELTLPLGISFYTFQTMSYTIDVYRRNVEPEKNIINFGAYVTMFPQLIAGPIVKYTHVADRLNMKKGRIDLPRIEEGIKLFIFGLAKKVLIANNVGALWTEVGVLGYAELSTPLAWLGIIAYSLQIYFDFSGYSLMAIGLGKMMGFDFPDNFNLPYISRSITEFWRRWHMTLSGWFREYVYIPLGGNRLGLPRQILNLLIVWSLTGFWHGADWNFVLWGFYYFILLTLEKLFLAKFLENHRVISHLYALFAIVVGWALFAVVGLQDLRTFLSVMFIPTAGISVEYFLRNYAVVIVIGMLASTQLPMKIYNKLSKWRFLQTIILMLLLFACVAYLVDATFNPFLYFRF